MSTQMQEPEFQELARLALAASPAPPREPPIEPMLISWKPTAWALLRIMKDYVKNNPDDIYNKRVYINFVKWYARSN